jgi:NADH-quinone oxidoreductase subunit M
MTPLFPVLVSFVGAAMVAILPASNPRLIRWLALFTALSGLIAVKCLTFHYRLVPGGFQWIHASEWIPQIGVQFKTGTDGLSLTLLLLTGIVAVSGVLFSWEVNHRTNEFFAYFLVLIGGVYGVFISLDLFLLFVFYEIAIIPKYFLIAIWGSTRKDYAAMKLALYSFTSSAVALFGLIALYYGSGLHTFDLTVLMQRGHFTPHFQVVVFPIIFVGFAVLAGMWPFHTWAPTGHVAAPTAASMLLAGVVMKLGAYGCLRVAIGILPVGAHFWASWIAWIAVINIVYGALAALAQNDFKFVIGYSSISHMGFVLLGLATLNASGLTGAALQMFSHGVIGALLFALVGGVIYQRTHTRELSKFDCLMERMPGIAWLFIATGLASMGLPGFSGFIAELHILVGVWKQSALSLWILIGSGFGILATFGYTLVKIHEAFFRRGDTHDAPDTYAPMTVAEKAGSILLLGTAVVVGLYPAPLINLIATGLGPILQNLQASASM